MSARPDLRREWRTLVAHPLVIRRETIKDNRIPLIGKYDICQSLTSELNISWRDDRIAEAYTSATLQPLDRIENHINRPWKYTPVCTIYRVPPRYRVCFAGIANPVSEQ